ncbi:uncharacterized protein LOC126071260 [Elephas maximus indicus]|uniref:uncharacterized protein LOC126071260 n=1 Tax=Elephas maximus indicus TaxID=99487 RepID=UPI00211610FD|nr:uncharacterized protein LOC126071260 [Elephas maximus indicus]
MGHGPGPGPSTAKALPLTWERTPGYLGSAPYEVRNVLLENSGQITLYKVLGALSVDLTAPLVLAYTAYTAQPRRVPTQATGGRAGGAGAPRAHLPVCGGRGQAGRAAPGDPRSSPVAPRPTGFGARVPPVRDPGRWTARSGPRRAAAACGQRITHRRDPNLTPTRPRPGIQRPRRAVPSERPPAHSPFAAAAVARGSAYMPRRARGPRSPAAAAAGRS